MSTITIRIDEELSQKIEEKRGDTPKSDYYRELLSGAVSANTCQVNTEKYTEEIAVMQADLKHKEAVIQMKDQVIQTKEELVKNMQTSLGWMQFEYQKLSDRLMLPAPEPIAPVKKWWEIWK